MIPEQARVRGLALEAARDLVMGSPLERLHSDENAGRAVMLIAVDIVDGQPSYRLVHPFDDDEAPNILVQALEQHMNESRALPGVRYRVRIGQEKAP